MSESTTPNSTVRVAVVTKSPLFPDLIAGLRAISDRLAIETYSAGQSDLEAAWPAAEVLYTDQALPAPAQAPNLRWVQGHFAGVEGYRDHPLFETVTLTNSSGIHAPALGEYVLLMMLAFAHRLPKMVEYQQRAEWAHELWPGFNAQELRGATVGIIGYGSIGREVGRLARAFGMRVLALKRNAERALDSGWRMPKLGDPDAGHADALLGRADLPRLLAESDYVVLAVPLTPATQGMLGRAEFAQMKPGAVLVNVARGGLVDEAAMIEALQNGTLGGAGLDVFAQEPLPADSPLWRLPNVLLSPHAADANSHYTARALALFADNLRRYLAGQPLFNVVDVAQGY